MLAIALTQEPYPVEPDPGSSAFQDLVDVAAIAVPLALVMLVFAMTSGRLKRWFRHRVLHRGRRRRRRRSAEQQALAASALPSLVSSPRTPAASTPGSVAQERAPATGDQPSAAG
jgi:hypothetical protein